MEKTKPAPQRSAHYVRATIPPMSAKPANVFISWSGLRSKHVATALSKWLPAILQSARPWLSSNIDKGARPLEEISSALETIQVGISCLTPENLTAPWILYEAGALSKGIGEKARLCTYLLAGLQPGGVSPPLGMFQHTRADKEETKQMVWSINKAIGDDPVAEAVLEMLFEKLWPELESAIKTMPDPTEDVPDGRPLEEMVAEILDMMRAEKERKVMLTSKDLNEVMQGVHPWRGFPAQIVDTEWLLADPACPRCHKDTVGVDENGRKDCSSCGATNHNGPTVIR